MGGPGIPKEIIACSYSIDYILHIKILDYHLSMSASPFRWCSDKMI